MNALLKSLIVSLILTLILEIISSILLRIRSKRDLIIVIIANICTNPVVVYMSNLLALICNKTSFIIGVLVLELLAILIEANIFKMYLKDRNKDHLKISIINNFISFNIGNLINIFL